VKPESASGIRLEKEEEFSWGTRRSVSQLWLVLEVFVLLSLSPEVLYSPATLVGRVSLPVFNKSVV
jgi:hypothetical protein